MRFPLSMKACIPLFIATTVLVAGGASGLPKFTEEQIKILESGELLKIPVKSDKSGGYSGGKSYILLSEDEETCYRVMTDIKNYFVFYDDTLIEAKILKSENNTKLVKWVYGKGPVRITYHSILTLDKKRHTIKYQLDKSQSNDLVDALGYIKFVKYDDNRVLMVNVALVDFGDSLTSKIFGKQITSGMLKLPKYVKWFLASPQSNSYRVAKN